MRRVLLAVLLTAGVMLLGAAPADAGGPTSVMLINPGQSQTAVALLSSDPQYAELEALLHGAGSANGQAGHRPNRKDATYFDISWFAFDLSVWRTDQVRIDRSGTAWIATWTDAFRDSPSSDGTWGQLDNGDRIVDLAISLGVIGAGHGLIDTGVEAAAVVPETGSAVPPAPVVREKTRWFALTGWRWALPGLLLGVMAAVVTRRRRTAVAPPARS